jgi:AcrR family transcriptional regulator
MARPESARHQAVDPGVAGLRVGPGPRRLDPSRDAAILQATVEGLAEVGYDRLSMDAIAARARAGKGAIYRRWPSKAALVVEALMWRRSQLVTIEVPDTGSLAGDVDALVAGVPELSGIDQGIFSLFLGVATAATRDADLAAAVDQHALARPRQMLGQVLERAVRRGEVAADRDLALLADVLMGLTMLRLATGRPLDRAFVGRVLREVVLPAALGPVTPGRPARRSRR